MPKYKVGDKVKIRSDLSKYDDVPFGVDYEMEIYAGERATITHVYNDEWNDKYTPAYKMDIDDGDWWWSEPMFEDEDYYLDKFKDFLHESF